MTETLHSILQLFQKLSSIVLPPGPLVTTPSPASSIPHTTSLWPGLDTRHPLFELEPLLSASAVFFCRFVVITGSLTGCPHNTRSKSWERVMRTIVSLILGGMAYMGIKYDLICAMHLWSHVLPWALEACWRLSGSAHAHACPRDVSGASSSTKTTGGSATNSLGEEGSPPPSLVTSILISITSLLSIPFCLLICRLFSSPSFFDALFALTPSAVKDTIMYMFPITEMKASYDIVSAFYTTSEQKKRLHDMLRHLLFVTVHIQFGLGHIGIEFLTSEQKRKNMLIRMDVENPAPDETRGGVKCSNGAQHRGGTINGTGSTNSKDSGSAKNTGTFDASRTFRRSAPSFIIFCVLPYMFQIILFGNLNNFSFIYVRNQIHKSVRIDELFNHDSHLEALASESATSPEAYASSMDKVVSTAYDVINRKLFSLPKLLLLPGVISRKPSLLVKIFPFIILTDILKGRLVASVTDKVEEFRKEAQDISSVRQKVEQYDMKNAELLRRSGLGATQFTQRRWNELTIEHQAKMAACDLLSRTRSFFLWLQRNFIFVALIDCALAELLAAKEIVVAEIFVFSRAIEDVVDLLLIRSRSESELATLMTQVDKLKGLDSVWTKSKEQNVLPCRIDSGVNSSGSKNLIGRGSQGIVLNNLGYSRGTAEIFVDHLVIEPGIYAVTGANGSGKSTLFRLLMACATNERPIDLHQSIELATPVHNWDLSDNLVLPENSCKAPDDDCKIVHGGNAESLEIPVTSIIMPSSDVVEISQVFYWPLYTAPIDWIYQKHLTTDLNETSRLACVNRVASELQSLSFSQSQDSHTSMVSTLGSSGLDHRSNDAVERLVKTLQEEREDWFSELSGGQKSKVELVRKVFLREHCPSVLLIDETMAPLDPASKSQVMSRLKDFCSRSVVLVIYHTDVGNGKEKSRKNTTIVEPMQECVPSNGFFDHNLHVVNKRMIHRSVC